MAQLIKLTDPTGEPMWVNPDYVLIVGDGPADHTTPTASVYIAGLPPLAARGSVQEVVNALTNSFTLAGPTPSGPSTRPSLKGL